MPTSAPELLLRLQRHISQLVLGKEEHVRLALTCLVARGHLLFEDVPGVGKTTLAEGLARSFSLSFARVPFTADVLPSDILGSQIFLASKGQFEFRPGPIFHQVLLADELNRAPPRTQSALLEAMAQGHVSIDGTTHALPQPFVVIATQNPLDWSGTYPLPDSQLDRFLLRISLGHLAPDAESQLLMTRRTDPLEHFKPLVAATDLVSLQASADLVQVSKDVANYVVRLAAATRTHPNIERGVSTRATLALMSAARAHALWDARAFVTPSDVKAVAVPTWSHRLLLNTSNSGAFSREEAGHLIEDMLRKVAAPT